MSLLTRDLIFDRVMVDYVVAAGATVSWRLFRHFTDAAPHVYELQFSDVDAADAGAWTTVASGTNVSQLTDPVRRLRGKEWQAFYRLKLTTSVGNYYSEPTPAFGILGRRDWLLARDVVRQFRTQFEKFEGWNGKLIKRRLSGTEPSPQNLDVATTDPLTGQVIAPHTTATRGTEFAGGFFAGVTWKVKIADTTAWGPILGPNDRIRNTEDGPTSINGFAIAFPLASSKDLFLHVGSGRYYEVWPVKAEKEWRGVPLIVQVELRHLPASDVAYVDGGA